MPGFLFLIPKKFFPKDCRDNFLLKKNYFDFNILPVFLFMHYSPLPAERLITCNGRNSVFVHNSSSGRIKFHVGESHMLHGKFLGVPVILGKDADIIDIKEKNDFIFK